MSENLVSLFFMSLKPCANILELTHYTVAIHLILIYIVLSGIVSNILSFEWNFLRNLITILVTLEYKVAVTTIPNNFFSSFLYY